MRLLILLAMGCDASTPMMMMTGEDLAVAPDMAMTGGMTNKQYCDTACQTLTTCGVEFGAGCSAGCQAASVFLACVKMTDLTNCNALSLCSFKQYAADTCAGSGGVPAGTNACKDTADCEANCNINQPNVAACPCNCIAGLLPVKASSLLINNQCALSKCSTECGPAGSGTACNTCAAQMCATEHAQCASQ